MPINSPNAIFLPVAGVMGLTNGVLIALAFLRTRAIIGREVNPKYYKNHQLEAGGGEPVYIANVAQCHENLTEMPPIFYAAAIALWLLEKQGGGAGFMSHETSVQLAWAYLGARVAHALVFVTSNNVNLRFATFLASQAAQVAMVVKVGLLALE